MHLLIGLAPGFRCAVHNITVDSLQNNSVFTETSDFGTESFR
jgi:hypothetical protein